MFVGSRLPVKEIDLQSPAGSTLRVVLGNTNNHRQGSRSCSRVDRGGEPSDGPPRRANPLLKDNSALNAVTSAQEKDYYA